MSLSNVPEALGRLRHLAASARGLQAETDAVVVCVPARTRQFEVTVNGRGEVTDVFFPDDRYRQLAPAELGALLCETIASAQDEARREVLALRETYFPGSAGAEEKSANRKVGDVVNGMVDRLTAMGLDPVTAERLRREIGV